jgi:hypothetical protein
LADVIKSKITLSSSYTMVDPKSKVKLILTFLIKENRRHRKKLMRTQR